MSDESIHNPHDQLFKEAFSRHETAVAFFESYLPAEIGSRLDWKSLQLQPCALGTDPVFPPIPHNKDGDLLSSDISSVGARG